MQTLEEILSSNKTIIIDVRSPMEFIGGHVEDSRNIPLQEIPDYIEELNALDVPMVVCCASGNRSRQAQFFLMQNGLKNIYDGGSWIQVNQFKNISKVS